MIKSVECPKPKQYYFTESCLTEFISIACIVKTIAICLLMIFKYHYFSTKFLYRISSIKESPKTLFGLFGYSEIIEIHAVFY